MARFHEGELAVQRREGVVDQASRVGASMGSTFPPPARSFLEKQRMLVVATRDPANGRVWTSLITGPAGFARAEDETTLRVDALPPAPDPFHRSVASGDLVGVLGIELATRRRMKAKGRGELRGDGFVLHPHLVYSLCPKYIQARAVDPGELVGAPRAVARTTTLGAEQQTWIAAADTLFLGTQHPETGPDASHRGGNPGFVHVRSERHLELGDYAGNNMFNTLGNLELDANAAMLFLDFEGGRTLQLAGKARGSWDPAALARHPGARRVIAFEAEEVLEVADANPLRFRFLDFSRFNPR